MADKKSRVLPEGWRIEGLWYNISSGNPDYREVNPRTVTDAEIASADRIIISYTSRKTGVTDWRTIPGADSKVMVGNIIRYTTRRVSPPGKRSR